MRIAFVSGNRERLPDPVVPYGLMCIMATTPAQHETELWDLLFEEQPLQMLARQLRRFQPDLVAVSMRNIQDNAYESEDLNLKFYAGIARTVRDNCDAKLVFGGSGFSIMPQALVGRFGLDFGISGEGELAFQQLLLALEGGQECFQTVGGLHYSVDGMVISNPPATGFLVLDDLPLPHRERVDSRYFDPAGIDSIQTKRGCPLKCDYCTYPKIEGSTIRRRSPKHVVEEMNAAAAAQPGCRHFFIVDSVFNLPPSHAKNVCLEIIRSGPGIPWTCYVNPIGFDSELAELMVEAGCSGVEIGSDSGVDSVLQRLLKGFDSALVRQTHNICLGAGLPDCHTFILGTPGESMDDVRQTLDFIAELDPFAAIIQVWVDDLESLDPQMARDRRALRVSIFSILAEKRREFAYWVIPAVGVNFDPRVFRLLRKMGKEGPLWQHIRQSTPALAKVPPRT